MHFPHTPQKNILNDKLLSGFAGAAPAGGWPKGCGVCSQPTQETPWGCRAAAPKHQWKPTFPPEEYFFSLFHRKFMVIQKRGEIDSLRNGFWEIQGLTKVYGGGGFQGKKVTIFQTYLMIKSAPHRADAGTWVVKRALGSPCPVCDTPSDDHLPPCLSTWCDSGLFNGLGNNCLTQLWQGLKQCPTWKPLFALFSWDNTYIGCICRNYFITNLPNPLNS